MEENMRREGILLMGIRIWIILLVFKVCGYNLPWLLVFAPFIFSFFATPVVMYLWFLDMKRNKHKN